MDDKKVKDDNLLDIPDFLRRLDEDRSTNTSEVVEQPTKIEPVVEAEPIDEKPKRPSIQAVSYTHLTLPTRNCV